MTKVSVIIPVYNTEKYLKKCLDSVCNQTLSDIEIICVNDCSTDNSLEILKKIAMNDNRLKVIELHENSGAAKARNIGINVATGEYIGFVDSDDFIDFDFYEKLYNKAIEDNVQIVKGTMFCYRNDVRDLEREAGYDSNKLIRKNIAYFYHAFTTAIYESKLIKNNKLYFPENLNLFEDPFFSIKVAIMLPTIAFVNSANYHYSRHSESVTLNIDNNLAKDAVQAVNKIHLYLQQADVESSHKEIVYSYLMKQLYGYWGNINFTTSVNKDILDLFILLYQDSEDKERLVQKYLEQERLIKMSLILKNIQFKKGKKC